MVDGTPIWWWTYLKFAGGSARQSLYPYNNANV